MSWRPGSYATPTPSSRVWDAYPTCWPTPLTAEGIIDAVDDWLEDPSAVMADSDQLLAQRAEQASADMRELIEALTGEISQVSDLVTRPGEPPSRWRFLPPTR